MRKYYEELLYLMSMPGVGRAKINRNAEALVELVSEQVRLNGKPPVGGRLLVADTGSPTAEGRSEDTEIITIFDDEYLAALKCMGGERPLILYARGDLSLLGAGKAEELAAVIGSREPSAHARDKGQRLMASLIEKHEPIIVSGLARGCDTIAHETALTMGAKTIAVLPSGIDSIWPRANADLAERIVNSGGLLISEYPNDRAATAYSPAERNRIIAALADAILVIQCRKKSGTMNTVRQGLKYGKPIGAYWPAELNYETVTRPSGVADSLSADYEGNIYIAEHLRGIRIEKPGDLKQLLIDSGVSKAEQLKIEGLPISGYQASTQAADS